MGFVVNGIDVSTIGARFDGLYLPPPSRPDKPLAVKTLIVPTQEYAEGRNVLLTTGRSVYTVAMRHLSSSAPTGAGRRSRSSRRSRAGLSLLVSAAHRREGCTQHVRRDRLPATSAGRRFRSATPRPEAQRQLALEQLRPLRVAAAATT